MKSIQNADASSEEEKKKDDIVVDESGTNNPATVELSITQEIQVKEHLNEDAIRIRSCPSEVAVGETEILKTLYQLMRSNGSRMLGYPLNFDHDYAELHPFLDGVTPVNVGDPFVESALTVHTGQIELAVLEFMSALWKMDPTNYWGYVTASGTEGNLEGLLLARERFPDGIMYASTQSHYSVTKTARLFKIEIELIPTQTNGEMDYDALAQMIKTDRPVIINANIGTTIKGAIDNIDRIVEILERLEITRERFHLHLDGAICGLVTPFVEGAAEINFFTKPIDSISISGHKFIGTPTPCGVVLCRKEHVDAIRNYEEYIGTFDNTILGSRSSFGPLFLWYSLRKKGLAGLRVEIEKCLFTARYFCQKLRDSGIPANRHPFGITVVFEKPLEEALIKRWTLMTKGDIAQIFVMKSVTCAKVDEFIEEFLLSMAKHGRRTPDETDSIMKDLYEEW